MALLEKNKNIPISISITEVDNNNNRKLNQLNRNCFEFKYVIGKGGFGKVWQVIYKKTKEKYALKEMSKTKIIDKKSQKFINNELTLLKKLHNDFIVNMYYAFQDKDNLYLVIDFLSGGDLRYHISRYHTFSEEQTRFFISCIIQGLNHIHSNNIIHRDIKPENLVLDSRGYVRITDFGIAKENEKDNSKETSGTPGYMSPEVILRKNHSFSSDFFAIGVIGFEFMKGRRPFIGTRNEIKEKMNNEKYFENEVKIKNDDIIIKKGCSTECIDFINSLLEINENNRLGNKNGIKELKEHQWLKYYMWEEIENKKLEAPFIPDFDRDNFDKDYCKNKDILSEGTKQRYQKIISSDEYQTAFIDFYFNKDTINKNDKKVFGKKKIVIDGNLSNKKLNISKSNKNKMVLSIKKYIGESSEENISNKNTKNNELIKEIINDNKNKDDMLNKKLNKNKKVINNIDNNIEDIYIRKLIIKNSMKVNNILSPYKYYNKSLSPKISIKNIFGKYNNNSSNSNINIKSEDNIKHNNLLNININNIKNKNTFTSANKNENDRSNNFIYKKSNSRKKYLNINAEIKQMKLGFKGNFLKYKLKNKNLRDLFFKKIYNPFTINKIGYNTILQNNNNKL